MSAPTWCAALDAFEQCLDAQEAALARGAPEDITTFAPPSIDTVVPAALVGRATRLLERSRALETALAAACARAMQHLHTLDRHAPARGAEPMYVDSRV